MAGYTCVKCGETSTKAARHCGAPMKPAAAKKPKKK
jgi:hypothetical protein